MDDVDVAKIEHWEKPKLLYSRFRAYTDVWYLVRIAQWYLHQKKSMPLDFKDLAKRVHNAAKRGEPTDGLVQLVDYVHVASEASSDHIAAITKEYWQFECLAWDYQAALGNRIYEDAILVPKVAHYESIFSPFHKVSTRDDAEVPKSDAVLEFLSAKFQMHPETVRLFQILHGEAG
jgi:hypothetical protein